MQENEEYGLPDVEYKPIDRGAQGSSSTSTTSNKKNMKDQRKKDSNAPVIIAIVVIALIVLVAGYFFIIKPNQEAAREQEQIALEEKQRQEAEAEAEAQRLAEEEAQAAEEEAARLAEEEAASAQPETGSITVLSEKSGRSYVVIGSFFDGDMAQDAGNKLASEGVSTYILKPVGKARFYRLAVEDFDSYAEATDAVEGYKATYGEEIWALKY